jgi:predicted amidohydrolase
VSGARLAVCQYRVEPATGWETYRAKQTRLVAEAAGQGAQLLVFPEYAALELSALLPPPAQADLPRQLDALQSGYPAFRAIWKELANLHQVHLLAPSFPLRLADGGYRNRAVLYSPGGAEFIQDKCLMTRFETEEWGIGGGDGMRAGKLKIGESELGFGIAICYDSEFPLLVRALREAGADLILVPSCTDGPAGYRRVRLACQARALENQCYVAQAVTVGDASAWSLALDFNYGLSGVFAPPDRGFPADGILALSPGPEPLASTWLYADLDLSALARVRRHGQVLNDRDWAASAALGGFQRR